MSIHEIKWLDNIFNNHNYYFLYAMWHMEGMLTAKTKGGLSSAIACQIQSI